MPRPKGSAKPPGSGRKAGTPNKRTQDAQAVARAIVDDPEVQALWLQQARTGDLSPTFLQLLCYYAWGKPKETVELSGSVTLAYTIEEHTRQANERILRLRHGDQLHAV